MHNPTLVMCVPERRPDGRYVCPVCGYGRDTRIPIPMPFVRECGPEAPVVRAEPLMPPLHQQVWNLTKALVAFVADGCATVSKEVYSARLHACLAPEGGAEHCENLINEERCGRATGCGCYIAVKAKGRAWDCPRGKWTEVQ